MSQFYCRCCYIRPQYYSSRYVSLPPPFPRYVENLRRTVEELSNERLSIDEERRRLTKLNAESQARRRQVVQSMFYFRATGETSREAWGKILADDFVFVQPITPYRSFKPAEVRENKPLLLLEVLLEVLRRLTWLLLLPHPPRCF